MSSRKKIYLQLIDNREKHEQLANTIVSLGFPDYSQKATNVIKRGFCFCLALYWKALIGLMALEKKCDLAFKQETVCKRMTKQKHNLSFLIKLGKRNTVIPPWLKHWWLVVLFDCLGSSSYSSGKQHLGISNGHFLIYILSWKGLLCLLIRIISSRRF